MSLAFSDTDTYRGIVQQYEEELGFRPGFISGNTTRLKQLTAAVNLAFDDYLAIALPASGRWQYDDANHADYPIIRTNIVAGQRDYPFTTDELGNLVLDVLRVRILQSATATQYVDLDPIDDPAETGSHLRDTSTGVPSDYDKLGNAIRFGIIPNYDATAGLEIQINREPSYFTHGDTAKKPGVPGIHHRWFVVRPAEHFARRRAPKKYAALRLERLALEETIREHFAMRNRDEKKGMRPAQQSNR